MKVALVAESFLPHTNGVTNSILRVIEHLTERGDEALVIAPESKAGGGPRHYGAATITRVPSVGCPGYRDVRLAVAGEGLVSNLLEDYGPDVVHLASPFILGWTAVKAADALGLPTVAVYQTEVPSYAEQYRIGWGEPLLWRRVRAIHDRATMTLAPSTYAMSQLAALGVGRLRLWPRGVDARRFTPSKRSDALRRAWAPAGEVVVGYVGRLAPEKRVGDLTRLAGIPGVSVVIVGDGPSAPRLRADMPHAHFTGFLGGEDLAAAMASFDIFVHCGEFETFCQSIQEAHASRVPAIAPRRGGPIDLITDGGNGHLYAPGDLDAMVGHVMRLAEDANLRARYAANARATVEQRTWHSVCDALMVHYRDAIDASAAPLPRIPVGVA
jgi:phosphatidylinositol alpha 1,6-mannosyltransferase